MNFLLLRTKKLCWHETDEEMAEEASYEETDSINRNCYLHGYGNDNYKRKRTWSQSKSLFLDRLKVQLPLNCVFYKIPMERALYFPPLLLRNVLTLLHDGAYAFAVPLSAICKHFVVKVVALKSTSIEHIAAYHHRRIIVIHNLYVLADDKMLRAVYIVRCVSVVIQFAQIHANHKLPPLSNNVIAMIGQVRA